MAIRTFKQLKIGAETFDRACIIVGLTPMQEAALVQGGDAEALNDANVVPMFADGAGRVQLGQGREARVCLEATWQGLPTSGDVPVDTLARVKNVGIGGSFWNWDGVEWSPLTQITLAHHVGIAAVTVAAETVVLNQLILGGLLGTKRQLQHFGSYRYDDTATSKTVRVRVGAGATGLGGTVVRSSSRQVVGGRVDNIIETFGADGSQNAQLFATLFSSANQADTVQAVAAIDTSVDWNYAITLQPPANGVSMQLRRSTLMLV